MKKLTAVQLKTIATSSEFLSLAKAVFTSRAFAQTMRNKVDSYAIPLFQSMNFTYSQEFSPGDSERVGKQIMHPSQIYLSNDDELFDEYIELLHEQHINHGFKIETKGDCPALIARTQMIQAENMMIEYMKPKIGMPDWSTLENREKILDLYLSMAAKNLK